jgi:hypothetical protein
MDYPPEPATQSGFRVVRGTARAKKGGLTTQRANGTQITSIQTKDASSGTHDYAGNGIARSR